MPDSFAAPGSRLCQGHASCTGVSALCPQDAAFPFCFSSLSRFLFLTTTAVLIKRVYESTALCNLHMLGQFPIWVFSDLRAVYPAAGGLKTWGPTGPSTQQYPTVNIQTLEIELYPPEPHFHPQSFAWMSTPLSIDLCAARHFKMDLHRDTQTQICRYMCLFLFST